MAALTVGGWFAQAFIDALFNKLLEEALDQFGAQSGLKADLIKLKHILIKIKYVLSTIVSHGINDANLVSWLASLRDAAYDADDILDECEFHAVKNRVESGSHTGISFSRIFSSGESLSAKLRSVLGRLEGITADVGDYLKLVELQERNPFSAKTAVERKETSSFLTETEVLGRETEREALISMLLDGGIPSGVDVIPIVGIGGVGKTTLAQLVYNDPRVEEHFATSCKVWLEGLAEDAYWSIFRRFAFGTMRKWQHGNLELIGQRIASKLKGLPLAAKTIGGLLNADLHETHWLSIMESELWELQQGEDDILPILRLSYHHLPPHLKQCFAYFSLFPKDYEFGKEKLVSVWIAQGFIRPQANLTMEGVGARYFDNLVHRSFFQASMGGKYTVHSLIHDLSKSVSASELFIVGDEKFCDLSDSLRHLSFCADDLKPSAFSSFCKFKKLRTVMFFTGYKPTFDRYLHDMFSHSECIRMIDFSGCNLKQLPESIGNLKLLKHLNLSFTNIERLPASLCGLYNLQVLNLLHCRIRILPTTLTKLVNLRHLKVEADKASVLPHIGKLVFLHELRKFEVHNSKGRKLDQLKEIKELRGKLHVTNLEFVGSINEAISAMMHHKKHLDSLWLEWSCDNPRVKDEFLTEEVLESLKPHQNLRNLSISCYSGSTSPSWLNGHWLRDLKEVCLINCRKLKQVPILNNLPFLKVLQITGIDLVKEISYLNIETNNHILFPSLEKLLLSDMPFLEEWLTPNAMLSMPNLESLQISDCPRLRTFPSFPFSLKMLSVDGVGFTTLPGWQERVLQNQQFASLSSLTIRNCLRLKSLREGLMENNLPVIEALYISDSEELSFLPEENIGLFGSLRTLVINDCPNLIIGDDGCFMLPSSVQQLTVSLCGSLDKLLAKYLEKLTSLESLEISSCPSISALPAELLFFAMRSLVSLCIINCEQLACIANPRDLIQQ